MKHIYQIPIVIAGWILIAWPLGELWWYVVTHTEHYVTTNISNHFVQFLIVLLALLLPIFITMILGIIYTINMFKLIEFLCKKAKKNETFSSEQQNSCVETNRK